MVRDGYFYAAPLIAAAILIGWLTTPVWAILPILVAFFLLWFFRDPDREVPQQTGAVVSPADGKVTDVSIVNSESGTRIRISIFLSVFDVHVNRSPIAGTIREVRYRKGKFLDARSKLCAEQNEQNIVTVESDGQTVVFKQIAGLLARRIVFIPKIGDQVARGQRVGMIKFGSRVDVSFDSSASLTVKVGARVQGGASVLAFLPAEAQLAGTGGSFQSESRSEGVR